ncbi:MAG: DapH/DapD/GlmU-related protein, partial [Chloroflexota bacterium]
ILDPATTYIDVDVRIGADTVIQPNTHLLGHTVVGAECEIGPDSVLIDTEVGTGVKFFSSRAESAVVGDGADVGPFSHLRAGARLGARVHVGNYAEVKNARIGAESRIGHFSYVGDATVGEDVNIGAGTVVCNFDGERKHHTHIGNHVFVGSGSMLVAPVSLGDGAATGAGAVVTRDVPAGERVAGVPARAFGRTGAAAAGNGRQDGAAQIQETRTETEDRHARQ